MTSSKATSTPLASLENALLGVKRVFLLTAGHDIPKHDGAMEQAAKEAVVKHIVKLSAMGADAEPGIALAHEFGFGVESPASTAWMHLIHSW